MRFTKCSVKKEILAAYSKIHQNLLRKYFLKIFPGNAGRALAFSWLLPLLCFPRPEPGWKPGLSGPIKRFIFPNPCASVYKKQVSVFTLELVPNRTAGRDRRQRNLSFSGFAIS
jgi:hypothetical protein